MLRLKSGAEPLMLDVERRGTSSTEASGPCMVASEVKLAEMLLAGETGAVRWAGFFATGGAAFCFAGDS
jgi:hypothetical protein